MMLRRALRTPALAARPLRTFASKPPGNKDGVSGSPRDGTTMPHVNEEVVAYDNILGGQKSPTEQEEGVPVADVLRQDPEALKKAPKVVREGLEKNAKQESLGENVEGDATGASTNLNSVAHAGTARLTASQVRLPYALPESDPVLSHLVGLIMKHGKKSQAQSRIQETLSILQRAAVTATAQAAADAGKAAFGDPLAAMKEAIEKVSPLVKLIQRKQGSKNVPVPIPLNEKGRRRRAIQWMLESADKRSDRSFAARFAQEIAAVLDGTSSAFQKKDAVHRLALVNRANASVKV